MQISNLVKNLLGFALSIVGAQAATGSLQQVTDFGSNPTGVEMYVYTPARLASPPPLVVGVHWCHGTADAFYTGTQFADLADTYGFIVIYPNASATLDYTPGFEGCWDVHTTETLTHDGGGDSLGIASMVRYAISNYGVDTSKVFVTGVSSGAMMTNVLCGAYPDLFKACSASSGVAFGCFAGTGVWSDDCATGKIIKTPQEWGDLVRAAYPSFNGTRPKFQFWHGTDDTTLYPQNYQEEMKQWTNIFGVSQNATSVQSDTPITGYTRSSYGPNVQGILASGVGHNIPNVPAQSNEVLTWFGLLNATL